MAFFLLVLAMSLPFWGLAQLVQTEPLPGLPLSGLMAFVPAVAALILVARSEGTAGVRALLARSFDVGRMQAHGAAWLLVVLMPVVTWLPALGGLAPTSPAVYWAPLAMLAAFFLAGLGEEIGWSAYILEPLAKRWGELGAALAIGGFWAAWHLIPFLQADRPLDWVVWQCVKTVAVRVVMARVYFASGRSLFAVALFHALDNVAAFSLPMWGGTYDARATALILIGVAAVLTLARRRSA
jgi:membrane protease YdiL (CAAX protease family)